MCGIVGYVGQREARTVLLDGLSRLEYRGYDSAGVAFFEKNAIAVYKSQGRLSQLAQKLEEAQPPFQQHRYRAYPLGNPRRPQRYQQPPPFGGQSITCA